MAHQNETVAAFGGTQKTFGSYMVGFVLSGLLTLLAFGLVEFRLLSDSNLYISLAVLAVIQLWVQALCFLRLNRSREGRSYLLPFLFTSLIIAILATGSLWIMYNLNYNMMH